MFLVRQILTLYFLSLGAASLRVPEDQKIHFLTYGSGKYQKAVKRISKEAQAFGMFNVFHAYDSGEELGSPETLELHKMVKHVQKDDEMFVQRGWPRIALIHKLLETELKDNDVLVYLDAGCTINKAGQKRFQEYLDIVHQNFGVLSMELPHPEAEYTNAHMMRVLNISKDSEIAKSNQIADTFIILRNNPAVRELVRTWKDMISKDVNLITDKYDQENKELSFHAHRHEQSLWSLLLKTRCGIQKCTIPDESYPITNVAPVTATRKKD